MKSLPIKTLIATSILLGTCLISCEKFIKIEPPITQPEQQYIFADDQSATSATLGIYQQMTASNLSFTNGAVTMYLGLLADELDHTNVNNTYVVFKNNALTSNQNELNSVFWASPYRAIYQANAIIEGLANTTKVSALLKAQLTGEALYIRALYYFYLVNLFGEVPLLLTTNYEVNAIAPRVSTQKVYQQIVTDLQNARALLPNQGSISSTRPGYFTATALLARVYLYEENWLAAEEMAAIVIASGRYTLEPLPNVFLANSKETLFGLIKHGANTAEGGLFIPSTSIKPTFVLRGNLLNSFEPNDNRKTNWLKTNTIAGVPYTHPFKYKVKTSPAVTENYIVQRFAELYLIRAEAKLRLNKLPESIADIDVIRNRAGLAKIAITNPSIDKEDLFKAICKEYQLEFLSEWGHRWLNLKRWHQADEVLLALKGTNWQPTDILLPIPIGQLEKNPFLTQNNGY